jgi:putative flippase GtrA
MEPGAPESGGVLRKLIQKFNVAALIRFFVGGLLSVGVTAGVTTFLHEIHGVGVPQAGAAGFVSSLVTNFLFMRFYVFRGTKVPLLRQLAMFLASSGVFRGLEYAGFYVTQAAGVHYQLALLLVLGCSFMLKFFVYEKLVFARKASPQQ